MFFINLLAGYIVIKFVLRQVLAVLGGLLLLIVLACGGRYWRLRRCSWSAGALRRFYGDWCSVSRTGRLSPASKISAVKRGPSKSAPKASLSITVILIACGLMPAPAGDPQENGP
jgi:hypothetical protein